ncbi:MAG: Ig-like domain-containing protein, partial [Terrabacter sp.]
MLARTGAIVALVAGGSLTGMQAASAAGEAPFAYDDSVTTVAGQPVDIVLSGSDVDGDPLTFAIASAPTSGTLGAIGSPTCDVFGSCEATVTYTPTSVAGVVTFTFTANDGTLTSAPATVDITVESPPPGSIISSGPLTRITTSSSLNCSVDHLGDTRGEWYGNTACGTLVAVGTSLYGPQSIPAGSGATGAPGYQPYTPVSQTGPTGAGTQASPYVLTTVVDLPGNGLRLTQTDSYVVGQESYRTDVALASTDGAAHSAIVYRAGDCYLQDSDAGLGQVFSGNAPNCKAQAGSTDPNRVEGFFPLTGPSHYMEAGYSEVWAAVGTKSQLPDTCRCAENIDNGIGLSWPAAIAAAGATTISSLTNFSPVGAVPVSLSKTADDPEVAAGAADGYTVTLTNPGAVPATLTSITDTLPVGFTYVAGSTTGVTTADPTVSGRDVTWTGTFTVPAATGGTPGTRTLHFGVTVSQQPGTYTNSVTGAGSGVTVLG